MFITNRGQLYWLKVYRIPEAGRTAIGKAVVNLIGLQENEKIRTTITTSDFSEDKSLVFFTKNGIVKRTKLSEYKNIRNNGIRAINLDEDDELVSASIIDLSVKELFIATREGQCIRFSAELDSIKDTGRATRGVIGIRFKVAHDSVIAATTIRSDEDKLLTISELGIGKQTIAGSYSTTRRGGKGVIAMKLTNKTGKLVSMISVNDSNMDLMVLTTSGKMIRVPLDSIREAGRNTSGVKIISLDKDDRVVHISQCEKEKEELEEILDNDE